LGSPDESTEYVRPRTRVDGSILLSPYEGGWAVDFEVQAARIVTALRSVAIDIEHVGSTSVPGLDAKPIIDVSLLVADSADESSYVPALEELGYVLHIREPNWYEHRLLRHDSPSVNLHVFTAGSQEHARMVSFRDRLRADPDAFELYRATKHRLAEQHWEHVQDYADAKTAVVEQILSD